MIIGLRSFHFIATFFTYIEHVDFLGSTRLHNMSLLLTQRQRFIMRCFKNLKWLLEMSIKKTSFSNGCLSIFFIQKIQKIIYPHARKPSISMVYILHAASAYRARCSTDTQKISCQTWPSQQYRYFASKNPIFPLTYQSKIIK